MFMSIPQPHVATLSLHSLFELRSLLLSGTVCLDMAAASLDQVADLALDSMINCGALGAGKKEQVKAAVLKKHRHQFEGARKAGSGAGGTMDSSHSSMAKLPIIRSLADIGRNHSASRSEFLAKHHF